MPPHDHTGDDIATVVIREARSVTPELVTSLARLVPQLSSSAAALEASDVEAIVTSNASILLIAEDSDGSIVGSLTLGVFRVPSGVRAWIEDVVVDGGQRGRGIGAMLVNHAIERAGQAGARSVDLTSRPSRVEANRLYQKLGFELRETNVYRWRSSK